MKKQWWHEKTAYQIYPKSFKDTNGDGIGDIRGVIEKLDYLKTLGIDIIWLSPIYCSPFVDQGYDISDYYGIAPEFGTMEDFDELLAEAKKRDMYIVMDLVINHCSYKHSWFQKALEDLNGEYADYFYFREGSDGNPPSNYRSYFGGSAWENVSGTNKYYLHMFAKEQPDLNWNNPKVVEALYTMINWWLEKGVAGFRIDAIINIKKNISFPSYAPDGPDGLVTVSKMVDETDGVGELLQDMKKHTFEKHDAFTVAEVFNMKEEELIEFIGDEGHFSTMFDFAAHMLTWGEHGWYDAKPVAFADWRRETFASQLKCQGIGFLANILENHDEPRGVCRYLPEYAINDAGIKMLGGISVLLRGLPFLYQGQEIGMRNCRMDSIDEYDDISTKNEYQNARQAGLSDREALACCYENSRDNARTPMQWDDSPQAGFTSGSPWLKVNPNYMTINVASQEKDDNSVLHFYRNLLALRKSAAYRKTFTYGDFVPVYEEEEMLCAFYRVSEEHKLLVAANFGTDTVTLPIESKAGRMIFSNITDIREADNRWELPSCGLAVWELPL